MWERPAGLRGARRRRASSRGRSGRQTARGFTSGGDQVEHFLATLGPGIELVGLVSVAPRAARALLVAREPLRAAHVVVGLDQVRTQGQGLPKEDLRVLVHLALEVHQSKIIVGVERGLTVVVEPDRLGEMLDRLAEDP